MSLEVPTPPWRTWMLGYGVFLPFLSSAYVLLASWPLWRRADPNKATWPLALAFGAGYAAGHVGIAGWPDAPPHDAADKLCYLSLAAVLLVFLDVWRSCPRGLRGMAWAMFSLAALGLLLPASLRAEVGTGKWLRWLAGLGAAGWLFGAMLAATARRLPGLTVPLVLFIASAGTTAVLGFGYSFKYAQLAGVVTAAQLPILLRGLFQPPVVMPVTPLMVILPGLWLLSYFYSYEPPPVGSFAALAAAVLSGSIGLLPGIRRLARWKRCLLGGLSASLLTWLAISTAQKAQGKHEALLRSQSQRNAVTINEVFCRNDTPDCEAANGDDDGQSPGDSQD